MLVLYSDVGKGGATMQGLQPRGGSDLEADLAKQIALTTSDCRVVARALLAPKALGASVASPRFILYT